MAAGARALFLYRVGNLSLNPVHSRNSPPPFLLPSLPATAKRNRFPASASVVSCLISGVDGGGVSDDFVSTRKSGLDRRFTVISNMLKRIEPLDTSVISKGVSDSAKESMKQTISTMLGLLPSDQFSVTVKISKPPLDRLLVFSIITGYFLWNVEYRISLMRNFEISPYHSNRKNCQTQVSEEQGSELRDIENVHSLDFEELERHSPQIFGDLTPEALNYIRQLQSELSNVEEEISYQKRESMQIGCDRGSRNDLLEYLRSLDPHMVTELSRPSSMEVEDIIHQLVKNILQKFFNDDAASSGFMEGSVKGKAENHTEDDGELCDIAQTSRDFLAKLLFWCMLLGHHLRGLENRLHLSCFVELL